MSDAAITKQDLQEALGQFGEDLEGRLEAGFEKHVDKRFDELVKLMSLHAEDVNRRFDEVDRRFDGVDMRFFTMQVQIDEVRADVAKLDASHHHVLNTLDAFMTRLDGHELDSVARDRQFGRLTDWAHKVAVKTSIPLNEL